jgi:hypothetical protein
MKSLAIAVVLLAAVSTAEAVGVRPQQRQREQPARPAAQRRLMQDAVVGFYVSQFRQATQASAEVFAKILPFIEDFIQDRLEISERRTRALNQLRQAINRNAPDEELRRLVRELDGADAEFQANQEKFFSNVDPLLDARQQARTRVFLNAADQRVRQMLEASRNSGGQRPNAATPKD